MFQRRTLSSKTANKKAIGTWLESNLRKSNMSFSNCLKARGAAWELRVCLFTACVGQVCVAVWGNSSSPQSEPIQFALSFFFPSEGQTARVHPMLFWCMHLPFITELFLLTQTKLDSPWTNYFSFLIGSAASLLVRACGYSQSTIWCPSVCVRVRTSIACTCCSWQGAASESSQWESPEGAHTDTWEKPPKIRQGWKNQKCEAVKDTWGEHAEA